MAPVQQLWHAAELPPEPLSWLRLSGADPVLPSSFAIGTAAQASIAAAGLAAAALHRQRGGPPQQVAVDMRHAAAEFRSERALRIDGRAPADPWDRIAGLYATADGWVRLHTNFPHHRDGVLRLLGCAYDREAVAAALRSWHAEAFEDAAAAAGLCATALRDFARWDAHPQGRAVQAEPLIAIERIDDWPPQRLPPADRPLAGVRVLDLTRIIAGPVCCRTLAAHGADVLLVTAPHLPAIASLVVDTGRGKRATSLDLRTSGDSAAFEALLTQADLMVQGYRPGGLAALGFGPEQAARLRPGIVYVSLCAYGFSGPWAGRRGFDSLTQTASGLNVAEAAAAGQATPRALPAQALDHASGYLMALGAMAALHRRATIGGSWHVRVSLARTGHWLRGLGRIAGGFTVDEPEVDDLLEESESSFGRLSAVRHAARLSATPAQWARPAVALGTHAPLW